MPIHSHSSQKDPQRVIKEVKKAIEDGEGNSIFSGLFISIVASSFVFAIISTFFDFIMLGSCRFSVCSMWSVLQEIFMSLCMA
jgi:hypothetical protein